MVVGSSAWLGSVFFIFGYVSAFAPVNFLLHLGHSIFSFSNDFLTSPVSLQNGHLIENIRSIALWQCGQTLASGSINSLQLSHFFRLPGELPCKFTILNVGFGILIKLASPSLPITNGFQTKDFGVVGHEISL